MPQRLRNAAAHYGVRACSVQGLGAEPCASMCALHEHRARQTPPGLRRFRACYGTPHVEGAGGGMQCPLTCHICQAQASLPSVDASRVVYHASIDLASMFRRCIDRPCLDVSSVSRPEASCASRVDDPHTPSTPHPHPIHVTTSPRRHVQLPMCTVHAASACDVHGACSLSLPRPMHP